MSEPLIPVVVWTVGCRSNQADREALIAELVQHDLRSSTAEDEALVYIIHSCCVTAEAERDTRRLVHKARRLNPESKVFVYGCIANYMLSNDYSGYGPWKDSVILVTHTDPVIFASRIASELKASHAATSEKIPKKTLPRAVIKIQGGCARRCCYCVVPMARGPGNSLALDMVLDKIEESFQNGSKEIVLTGINLGDWGLDLMPQSRLDDLLERIQATTSHPEARIRLSSIEPWSVSEKTASFISKGRPFCRHLHIPLQAGNEALLERMGRRTDLERVRRIIQGIMAQERLAAVGLDLIAGLPGESEPSFRKTVEFVESLDVAYLHVFGYSPRKGTRARDMDGQVPKEERKKRVNELIRLGRKKTEAFLGKNQGREAEVLVTGTYQGKPRGLTDNFIEVLIDGAKGSKCPKAMEVGELVRIRLTDMGKSGRWMIGHIIS